MTLVPMSPQAYAIERRLLLSYLRIRKSWRTLFKDDATVRYAAIYVIGFGCDPIPDCQG